MDQTEEARPVSDDIRWQIFLARWNARSHKDALKLLRQIERFGDSTVWGWWSDRSIEIYRSYGIQDKVLKRAKAWKRGDARVEFTWHPPDRRILRRMSA
jgi:hypothetical protein